MRTSTRLDPRSVEIVDEDVARILRTKTGAERLRIAFGMYTSAHRMLTNLLKADHPDWSEQQVREEVGRRLSHGYTAGYFEPAELDEECEAFLSSAEEVILKKMDFFQQGGSEKHLRDITGILMVSGEGLDHDYIESWADQMGLETIWRTIKYLVRQKQTQS